MTNGIDRARQHNGLRAEGRMPRQALPGAVPGSDSQRGGCFVMKERPIIFSGPMVRTILKDRKTQTRRVIKPQPANPMQHVVKALCQFFRDKGRSMKPIKCPYGQPGDGLWVRETWAAVRFFEAYEDGYALGYADDWEGSERIPKGPGSWCVLYRADGEWEDNIEDRGFAWRPSIHMPRWASRITLEVTGVRVERVQDITDGDVAKEGVTWGWPGQLGSKHGSPARDAFAKLWDSLNAKRGYGWDMNPWVWVLEFKRLEGVE